MQKYKIGKIIIGEKYLDEIIDEDNIKWYPLNIFLTNILHKSDKVSSFRDSEMIRYMRVIEYSSDRPGMKHPKKTWCINENGVKYLLRHMNLNKKGSAKSYKLREKGFFEACLYFNVKKRLEEMNPIFINEQPSLKDYDLWSRICIQNDMSLNQYTKWKKCNECGYYYPYKNIYFGDKKNTNSKCLQCQNKDFKCKNKIIQFIYDNDGFDLLYKMENSSNEEIVKELNKFIERG